MRRCSNAWYEAIFAQLRAAEGPLVVGQIWHGIASSGFRHASKLPRSTLSARIAELVQLKKLERVGPATYQMSEGVS